MYTYYTIALTAVVDTAVTLHSSVLDPPRPTYTILHFCSSKLQTTLPLSPSLLFAHLFPLFIRLWAPRILAPSFSLSNVVVQPGSELSHFAFDLLARSVRSSALLSYRPTTFFFLLAALLFPSCSPPLPLVLFQLPPTTLCTFLNKLVYPFRLRVNLLRVCSLGPFRCALVR